METGANIMLLTTCLIPSSPPRLQHISVSHRPMTGLLTSYNLLGHRTDKSMGMASPFHMAVLAMVGHIPMGSLAHQAVDGPMR